MGSATREALAQAKIARVGSAPRTASLSASSCSRPAGLSVGRRSCARLSPTPRRLPQTRPPSLAQSSRPSPLTLVRCLLASSRRAGRATMISSRASKRSASVARRRRHPRRHASSKSCSSSARWSRQTPSLELAVGSKPGSAASKSALVTKLLGQGVGADARDRRPSRSARPRGRRIGETVRSAASIVADQASPSPRSSRQRPSAPRSSSDCAQGSRRVPVATCKPQPRG